MFKKLTRPIDTDNKDWIKINAVIVVGMMTFFLLFNIIPIRFLDLFKSYGRMAIGTAVVLYLYHYRFGGEIETKLFLVYIIWLSVTRFFLRDFYLLAELRTIFDVLLMFIVFSTSVRAERSTREKIMNALSLILGGYAFVLAVLGIFVALTNTYIIIPPENVQISIRTYVEGSGTFNALDYYGMHRNNSSILIYTGIWLMMYQYFACRKKLWRIPIIASALLEFIAVSLCHSRNVQVILAASIGMLVGLLMFRKYSSVKKLVIVPAVFFTAAVVLVAGYKLQDAAALGISKLSAVTAPAFEQVYHSSENRINPYIFGIEGIDDAVGEESEDYTETANVGLNMSDTRDFANDLKSFTGRTGIWKDALKAILNEPRIGLYGLLSETKMEAPIRYAAGPHAHYVHMHNYLMEVLILTGIPGFLLVVAFTIAVLLRMIRLFFCTSSEAPVKTPIMTIPTACLLIYFMLEIGPFTLCDSRSLSWFLAAGMAIGEYYSAFPEKKKVK